MSEQIFDPSKRNEWSDAELMEALELESATIRQEIAELNQAELFGPLPAELKGELMLLSSSLTDCQGRLEKVKKLLEDHRGERH